MANPSLQIGNSNWAIKEDNLLGYSTAGTRFVPQPITMTRESAGTRVNSSGLVETVELLGSEEIVNGDFATDSDWVKGTNITISNGSAVFTDVTPYAELRQNSVFTIGKTYKINFTVSGFNGGSVLVQESPNVNPQITVINASNDYSILYTAQTTTGITFKTVSGTVSMNLYNISVKESTKNNLARVDYDGTASSLLVEPQRINVNTYSEDFSQSFYIKDSGVSVGTTNNVSPSGESNATQIEVNNNGRIYANVASDTYASSIFIKAGTFAYFKFGGNVDLVAGTFSGGTIESFGNGWFKITKQYTGNRPFQIQAYPDGTYSSHTTTGDYYTWGSQIEAGSYATSYIPTDGGTVTRVQDQYSKTGISNLINSEEGVLFLEVAALANDGTSRAISIFQNGSNFIKFLYSATSNRVDFVAFSEGNLSCNITKVISNTTENAKFALKWKQNDFALWIDGIEEGTDLSGNAPLGMDKMYFTDEGGSNGKLFGKVKQLQVFKTALTDSELATLTTI